MKLADAEQVADYYGWKGWRRDWFVAALLRAGGWEIADIASAAGCSAGTAARRIRNGHETWGETIFRRNAARCRKAGEAAPAPICKKERRLRADGLVYVGLSPVGEDRAADAIGMLCRQIRREAGQ